MVIWYVHFRLVIEYINTYQIWEIIYLLVVLLLEKRNTICWHQMCKFIKKNMIDYDTLLGGIYVEDSDLKESFEELELYKIHSNFDE